MILGRVSNPGAFASCGTLLRPAPAKSVSRFCSRLGSHWNNYEVAGMGLQLGSLCLSGSSVLNSAQTNSACCGSGSVLSTLHTGRKWWDIILIC